MLATHYLKVFAAEMGQQPPTLSREVIDMLKAYAYPGNIRELKNIIERALIQSGGETILPEHLYLPRAGHDGASPINSAARKDFAAALPLNLAEAEDVLIQRALDETGGNIAEAARLLGVHRTRIYRKLAQEEPATN